MNIIEIIIIAISLAMDSMTVSITKSFQISKKEARNMSFVFGLFQGIMTIIGYLIANLFNSYIKEISNIISFIILSIIGLSMLFTKDEKDENLIHNKQIELLLLAIATSIDALSIGVSISITDTNIVLSSLIIGTITLILSYLATKLGKKLGKKIPKRSEKIGGVLLIIIGIKILLKKKNI